MSPTFIAPSLPAARKQRPHQSPKCTLRHLPQEAYTTLQPDGTPLCRLITGMWQTSGQHGYTPATPSVTRAIDALVDAGFHTFDLSNSYGDAELFASAYRALVGRSAYDGVHFCTRLVLDAPSLQRVCRRSIEGYVDRSLTRMAQERIHLLQLQWSDFGDGRFVDVLGHLQDMKAEGKIRSLGVANFPTRWLRYVDSQGIAISSNQVSYSLLDRRPAVEMTDWCAEKGIALLAYSTLGGGFISEKYLGLPEPTRRACGTASLLRFSNLIRVWGGWSLFQELLYGAKRVADKHGVSIANVAVQWVLRQPGLSAVIVGARLGMAPETDHTRSHVRTFEFELDDEDVFLLDSISMKGNDMYRLLGDSGNEFRIRQ